MQDDWDDKTIIASDLAPARAPADKGDRAYLVVVAGSRVGEVFGLDRNVIVGRGREADVRIQDVGISRAHARLNAEGTTVTVEDLESTNGTFVNGTRIPGKQPLQDGDKLQFGTSTILRFTYQDEMDEKFQRKMFESASRDALTGAFNKRYFMERLNSEFGYALRHTSPLSLVLFDIDHFKQVNDTHGHLAGDRILSGLAAAVSPAIRGEDVFARYGGEEFAVLSRSAELAAAIVLGGRLRKKVEESEFVSDGTKIRVTISVGVAALPYAPARTPDELIAAADQALYRAKSGGRNRVEVYRSIGSEG